MRRWLAGCLLTLAAGTAAAGDEYARHVAAYIEAGVESNLALQGAAADVARAQAQLDEARARWRPTLALAARYSRAEGGRTIDLPVGELVNPAYRTLNQLLQAQGQPGPFSDIGNQQISFLREREQDPRLSLTMPIHAPAIVAGVAAADASLAGREAALAAYRRALERDIEVAYLDWLRAQQALRIVEASHELLAENLRVNRVLHENGKITRDQVLRAQAEMLALEQQALEAGNGVQLARNYFNFLLNRPFDAGIEAAEVADTLAYADRRLAAHGGLDRLTDTRLEAAAASTRGELEEVAAQIRAARAGVDAERAAFQPTLVFALDAGVQGEDYGFGSGRNFAMASLVLDWKLWDGGQRKARVAAARAQLERAQIAHEQVADQIGLQVRQAADRLRTAQASLATAQARAEAAAEAFRIAARKRDAGSIAQVEFIDARSALTGAELNLNLTRFDVLVRLAELRAAVGD
ncbi:MAG: TolC family protein [Xanthomonadales bacterium]|nr:TolC family protein [Xanthomonadales bacterium]